MVTAEWNRALAEAKAKGPSSQEGIETMSVRKRIWKTAKGESKEAWIVDYVDAQGDRHIETFQTKKDATAKAAQVSQSLSMRVLTPLPAKAPQIAPVDLIFAALILEYVDVAMTMRNFQTLCAPDGALVVIVQADSDNVEKTSPSPYKSIQLLAPAMRLLDVDAVKQQAIAAGFLLASSRIVSLRSGKELVILCFNKN